MRKQPEETGGTSPKSSNQEAKLGFEPRKLGFIVHTLGHKDTEPLVWVPSELFIRSTAYVGFSCFRIAALDGLCQLSPGDSFKSRFPCFPLLEACP